MYRAFFLFGLFALLPPAVSAAPGLTLELPRNAYFRGENIPLSVKVIEAGEGTVDVFLGETRVASQRIQGEAVTIPVPTAQVRVGEYALQAVLRAGGAEATAAASVIIARRPPAARLEVWLWTYGGGACTSYFDHGFTIAGGPVGPRYKESDRASYIRDLDGKLARGAYSTLFPCGGISRSEMKDVDPTAEDVAFQGAARHGDGFFNPFSPEVERARRDGNRKFMEALGVHPAAKVAFFNTELVDNLWLDNLNKEGVQRTKEALGFTRDERGAPKFVAPGVLADDDRGYAFQKYVYTGGNALAYASQKTAEDVKAMRPDMWTLTDPFRQVTYLNMFPGVDTVGTWTYTNNDPKLMLYYETMRALTRGTKQFPLQVVTLLNYPGALAPRSVTGSSNTGQWFGENPAHAGWMLMGPDRCKEVSWIILSRAPRVIGYYFSSACDPDKYNVPEVQFRVPHATSDAIQELSERVYKPYGQMITRLNVAKRRIAVLSSAASRLYGKSPRTIGYPNEQTYALYSVLAMAHLDGDVLFDEHVEQGALKEYDVLVLPFCDVVTKRMYDEILAFTKRGGIVGSDQHLGPDIPGAIKIDFDFSYRTKVNADAIESGVMFAEWDDHLNPKTAELSKAKGVPAEDDQKIMESYARRLKERLAGKVVPAVSVDTPRALVNLLEKNGVKYLALINDHRAYDERTGKYKAIMEKLLPQTVTVSLREWVGPLFAYDMLERKPLPVVKTGKGYTLKVGLDELGGKLVALTPVKPAKVTVSAPAVKRGGQVDLAVALRDAAGKSLPGLQPLRVTITDAQGRETEFSGYSCAENGRLSLPFAPALNDAAGKWKVAVEDLTAGLRGEAVVEVR